MHSQPESPARCILGIDITLNSLVLLHMLQCWTRLLSPMTPFCSTFICVLYLFAVTFCNIFLLDSSSLPKSVKFHFMWKVQSWETFQTGKCSYSVKLNLAICPLLDSTINASSTFSNKRTVKGHILPFPLLMKCQAIDLPFSSMLIWRPLWPLTPVPVMFQSLWRSLHNLKDVGVVQVKVIRAEGLMVADVTGKTLTLNPNNRTITSAVYIVKSWSLHFSLYSCSYIHALKNNLTNSSPFLLLFCNFCWCFTMWALQSIW